VASNSITATSVPDAPIIGSPTKISDTVVSLTFTPPADGGKSITGYTIQSSPSVSLTTSVGTTSPLTATGSFAGAQTYTFTIYATNANGNSIASSASSGIIMANNTVPAKPAAPTVTTAALQDTVTWVAPANGGSPITGYTWASSDGKGGTVSGSTLSVVVNQEANTSQTYTVYATNAIGNSPTSDPSNSVTTPPFFPPFFPGFGPFFPPFFPFFPFFPPFFPGFVYSSKKFKHSINKIINISLDK
jgi:titin